MKVTLTSSQAFWLNEIHRDTKKELPREHGVSFCIFVVVAVPCAALLWENQ